MLQLPWNRQLAELRGSLRALQDLFSELESKPPPDPHPFLERLLDANLELRSRLLEVESQLKDMTHAVSEGIERTARAERRIGQTVARARKELADHGYTDPGLDAEATELRVLDGGGGAPQPVPEVPEVLGDPGGAPSSVPGLTITELQKVRGLA